MKQALLILGVLFITLSCQKQADVSETPPEAAAPCICAEIYAPVCGADGKTYPNACHAGCKNVSFTEGECQAQQ